MSKDLGIYINVYTISEKEWRQEKLARMKTIQRVSDISNDIISLGLIQTGVIVLTVIEKENAYQNVLCSTSKLQTEAEPTTSEIYKDLLKGIPEIIYVELPEIDFNLEFAFHGSMYGLEQSNPAHYRREDLQMITAKKIKKNTTPSEDLIYKIASVVECRDNKYIDGLHSKINQLGTRKESKWI